MYLMVALSKSIGNRNVRNIFHVVQQLEMSWNISQLDYNYIYFSLVLFGRYVRYKVYLSIEEMSNDEIISNDGLYIRTI